VDDIKPYIRRPNWVATDKIDKLRPTDTYDVDLMERLKEECDSTAVMRTVNKPLVLGWRDQDRESMYESAD
jgi:hypothetical protein